MIAVVSTVHPRWDTRIRVKELPSLAEGLQPPVRFFVQDGKGDEGDQHSRISITDTGSPEAGRIRRFIVGGWRMYRALRTAHPRVVHFHDPELIPMGILLRLSGVRVIYDVHEDVPRQILGKDWIPSWLRRVISFLAGALESVAGRMFDGIVAATPTIAARFPRQKTALVQNFPLLNELVSLRAMDYLTRPSHFAYVGSLTPERGASEMVSAIGLVPSRDVRLQLAGELYPESLRARLQALDGWNQVDVLGWAARDEVAELLGRVRAGLVLFHPAPNHVSAQPNKMFEYMAAGLPVIASDFGLWREIVEGAQCGLLVDPLETGAIADAMQWILDHPAQAEAMGRRGRDAVEHTYNWGPEARSLIALYRRILGNSALENV